MISCGDHVTNTFSGTLIGQMKRELWSEVFTGGLLLSTLEPLCRKQTL